MSDFQREKLLIRDYTAAFDASLHTDPEKTLLDYVTRDYCWRGVHPFYESEGAEAVVERFWNPLSTSIRHIQRREDIFFAGRNIYRDIQEVWTCSMGHFMGLFDKNWLDIPATRKVVFLPYAEFHRVEGEKIAETALFIDIIRVTQQAGLNPVPQQTAAPIVQPGPRTHDGICLDMSDPAESQKTLDLLDEMVSDLSELNVSGNDHCPPEFLARTWHEDMIWYGPAGIGTTYTIPRYQEQHQYPFRSSLTHKVFNGHVTRIAEGNYAGWFGWPNLYNVNKGGFLGLPGSDMRAEMRIVDIYRRNGDRLAENWVFIDLLHYCTQHGVDLLKNPDALQHAS
ncbi:MAG: nuclear transport factor 2 family protein [Hyphomonadaceae bacterium]|nr:nuclear transport factor 2 family protein [Hyphomonadaceae bacterium]MBC6411542.1 nuclear transport factor 2 family protein [Hyphomonadaceae bacterium]